MNDNKIIILIHYVKHVSIIKHDMSKRLNNSTKYCVICTMQKKTLLIQKIKNCFKNLILTIKNIRNDVSDFRALYMIVNYVIFIYVKKIVEKNIRM